MKKTKGILSAIMLVTIFSFITVSAAKLTEYKSYLTLSAGNTLQGGTRYYQGGVFRQQITADTLAGSTTLQTRLVYSTGVSSISKSVRTMSFSGVGSSPTANYGSYATGNYYYIYTNTGSNKIVSNQDHVVLWTATS